MSKNKKQKKKKQANNNPICLSYQMQQIVVRIVVFLTISQIAIEKMKNFHSGLNTGICLDLIVYEALGF